MNIIFGLKYIKQYKKLPIQNKLAVQKAIDIFLENHFSPCLRNHALKGEFSEYRSINAGFDLRIIFREENNYTIVYFIQVGSHNQIYG